MSQKKSKSKKLKKAKSISYKTSVPVSAALREDSPPYMVETPRKQRVSTVAASRKYAVEFVSAAKSISTGWLKTFNLEKAVGFGLPEVDDRYHIWRVPLVKAGTKERIGEVVIDAYTSLVSASETTAPDVLEARLLGWDESEKPEMKANGQPTQMLASFVRNTVILGDSEQALLDMPSQSVDLIFTSPPYYNARPEYEDYLSYESYLLKMRRIIHNCHRVLSEGRFFAMNVSPVLIRRAISYWPIELAQWLSDKFNYKSDISIFKPADLSALLKKKLSAVSFENFVQGLTVAELDEQE